jgi:hypothetical protein
MDAARQKDAMLGRKRRDRMKDDGEMRERMGG